MSTLQQGIPPIEQLLPHAAPMILIDRVVAVNEEQLQAELEIRTDSLFHNGSGVGACAAATSATVYPLGTCGAK